ncbi:hypothetical protein R1sor_007846 [Riccia sorocarpa]|uniref:Uncharacterized protein n=1 Tax=Riccia sorocarpa TaxID=122646 RepID=A0ABD3HV92_9MARC
MAPFTSRDKKKAKRDPSPGSREAGEVIPIVPPSESSKTKKTSTGSPEARELIPIVPPGESSKTKKTKSGPKTTIDERDERKRENAIIHETSEVCHAGALSVDTRTGNMVSKRSISQLD